MMVVRTASEVGLPASVKAQMMLNVAFDFVVGLVPFLGDLLDMAFKANTRNAIVLESYLRERGAENIRRQGLPPQQDPSLGEVFDEQQQQQQVVVGQQPIAQPPPSYPGAGGGRGWFGSRRVGDVEAQRPSGSGAPREEEREEEERHAKGREGSHARRERSHGGKHKSSKHGGSRNGGSRRESSRGRSNRQESGVTGDGR